MQSSTEPLTPKFGPLFRTLLVSVVAPLVVAQVLLRNGMPAVEALAIAAVFPLAEALYGLVKARRFEPIAVLSLIAVVAGIGLAGFTGNAGFAVAKESIFTAVFGVVFLGSLAAPRPMIFVLGRQYASGDDPTVAAAWDERWAIPGVRRTVRLITLVWGCGFLIEAGLRVIVAFRLPATSSTIVSPLLGIVTFGLLIVWTLRTVRLARQRAAAATT
ncbi:MAG TPA: VC0807 family protein [Candidatus Elarobacter sp.]|jgi:intracellular septation protein A|nr:VC0807 family protein [Candidatus Elarobacter sp.]